MAFKDDIQGQNTQIYPVVVIQKDADTYQHSLGNHNSPYIFLSTNATNIDLGVNGIYGNYHCRPILLNVPKIKESVDIETRNFKISNITLDISNYLYEGERFSNILSQTSLINTSVAIYFKSNSTNFVTPIEAPSILANQLKQVYQGIIRRVEHDDEKVTIEIEDLTEKKAHKSLPLADNYIQTESVPDKYKNKPTPIVYGEVDRSPVALDVDSDGDIILVADSNDDISGFVGDAPLYIHKSDTYLNAPMDAVSPKTGEPMFRWIKDPDDSDEYITRYNTGVQYSFIGNTITLNGSVSDAEGEQEEGNETGNAIGDNKIVVSQIAYPNAINPIRKKIGTGVSYYSVKHDYNSVNDDFVAGDEVEHNNLPIIIRGIIYRESVNFPYAGWQQQIDSNDITAESMWETTNDLDVDGDIFQIGKSGCIVKLPIVEGIGKQDDDTKLSGSLGYIYADISAGFFERELFDFEEVDIDFRIGGHKYQDHDGTDGLKRFFNVTGVGEFNNDFDYSGGSGAFVGLNYSSAPDGEVYNSISGNDDTVIVHKSSSLLLYTRFHHNTNNAGICFMQMQIKDLYVNQLDLVDNLLSQSFYAHVRGRRDSQLYTDFQESIFIQNPIDIIKDIVINEIGHDNIDEAEYIEARNAHADWKFGFTVNKKISSKKLIEGIAKSTKCFPKFKNDGSFGFNTVKDSYTLNGDYVNATPIKESEVISYSFKKTKPEQIYKKVTVSYNKDYAQDSYAVTTTPIDLGADDYYGIEDSADTHLEFESDYIRDEETAGLLASFLSEQYKNDHLIFNLKLPLHYIDLEIGDLVKFESLFQGIKSYGITYTALTSVNSQTRYPLFMVTSTAKNLDSVSVECMQLHALGNVDNSDWDDEVIEPEDTTAPVITFGDAPLSYTVGDDFVPFTAIAVDDTDGELDVIITYSNTMAGEAELAGSYSEAGSFQVFYEAVDSSGNIANASQSVTVEAQEEEAEEGELFGFGGDVIAQNSTMLRVGIPLDSEEDSLEDILPQSQYYKITVSSQGQPLVFSGGYELFVEVTHLYFGTNNDYPNTFILNNKRILSGDIVAANNGFWQFENGDSLSNLDTVYVELETYNPFSDDIVSGTGDANQDGGLNILDIVLMINFILSPQIDPTGEVTDIMDMTGDGVVNILDIVTLVNTILDES